MFVMLITNDGVAQFRFIAHTNSISYLPINNVFEFTTNILYDTLWPMMRLLDQNWIGNISNLFQLHIIKLDTNVSIPINKIHTKHSIFYNYIIKYRKISKRMSNWYMMVEDVICYLSQLFVKFQVANSDVDGFPWHSIESKLCIYVMIFQN